MKRLSIGIFLLILSFTASAQHYFETQEAKLKRCIVLMNPTVNNLRTMFFLIDNRIFDLPDHYNLVGFYHQAQAYDFNQSLDFIVASGRSNVFLQVCEDNTGPAVFGDNPCSDDFRVVFTGSDGVVFFGGPDIPPVLYGSKTNLLTVVSDYYRHTFEASFLFHLLGGYQSESVPLLEQKPEYKILGICLGMQTINVATGGTLIQDIPTEIYHQKTVDEVLSAAADSRHRNYHTNYGTDQELIWGHFHKIKISASGRLQSIMNGSGSQPFVLSSHHQGADQLGKGLLVAATSTDGRIVEALIHDRYPNVLGVQFHPEPMFLYQQDYTFKSVPNQTEPDTYIGLYGGAKGETFNRNIWKWLADGLRQK